MLKLRNTALSLLLLVMSTMSLTANAGASANVGFVSDYYFRSVSLGDAAVYAGADFDTGGFFVGTWWIDDGDGGNDGLETDFYFGYGMEYDSFSWSVGYNRYEYTYTSDYEDEIQILLGAGLFSLELTTGEDHDVDVVDLSVQPTPFDIDEEYTHFALGVSGDVFGVTIGSLELDTDPMGSREYIEFSAGGEIAGFDVSFVIGDASYDGDEDTEPYMYLDVSKSFDF